MARDSTTPSGPSGSALAGPTIALLTPADLAAGSFAPTSACGRSGTQIPRSRRPARLVARAALLAAALVSVAANAAVMPWPAHAQATLVVDDDGKATATDCDANRPASSSIQAAVDAAASGSTILVCPGTYAEQVVVTKNNLTLRGTVQGLTVLRPSALPVDPLSPGGVPRKAILLVNGATGVIVASLTIDGRAADGGATNFSDCSRVGFTLGLYYRNGSGTVDATHITNVRSAERCSAGIFAESGGGGATNLEVKGNTVDTYGMNGVVCNGPRTACTVTGNTLRGRGRVDDQVQLGLVIRFGAAATIAGNVIRDHYFTPTRDDASIAVGLLFLSATPESSPKVLRETNTFIDNELDIQRLSSGQAL